VETEAAEDEKGKHDLKLLRPLLWQKKEALANTVA